MSTIYESQNSPAIPPQLRCDDGDDYYCISKGIQARSRNKTIKSKIKLNKNREKA